MVGRLTALLAALRTGRLTLPYPYQPAPAPRSYRGPPVFLDDCIGCGACTYACPAGALSLRYLAGDDVVVLEHSVARCIFCMLCADVCPMEAVRRTSVYELATDNPAELVQRLEHRPAHCADCGAAYSTLRAVSEAAGRVGGIQRYMLRCPDCRAVEVASVIASSRRGGGLA